MNFSVASKGSWKIFVIRGTRVYMLQSIYYYMQADWAEPNQVIPSGNVAKSSSSRLCTLTNRNQQTVEIGKFDNGAL